MSERMNDAQAKLLASDSEYSSSVGHVDSSDVYVISSTENTVTDPSGDLFHDFSPEEHRDDKAGLLEDKEPESYEIIADKRINPFMIGGLSSTPQSKPALQSDGEF